MTQYHGIRVWQGLVLPVLVSLLFTVVANGQQESTQKEDTSHYLEKVRPILQQHCWSCHGSEEQAAGLRLDNVELIRQGGDSGVALKPGDATGSLLWQRVNAAEASERMPPEGERLNDVELAIIRQWIEAGAKGNDPVPADDSAWKAKLEHWAWKPMQPQLPPRVLSNVEPNSPIDSWILKRLADESVTPSPLADKSTLLRRLYFDLIGLPPSSDELNAFLQDEDPNAFGKVVDRLLASPRYGERWARHWLDVVHYGDTHGYDKDKPRPNAWPYRDYVIRALNDDRPYSLFIQQQVAGDTLPVTETSPTTMADNIEALGFISAGPWDFIGHAEVPESKTDGKIARHLDRDNMVATVIGSFNSITINCAQCHNHKFDPFTQGDYYSLQAVFAALDRSDRSYYSDPSVGERRLQIEDRLRQADTKQAELQNQVLQLADHKLSNLKKPGVKLTDAEQQQADQLSLLLQKNAEEITKNLRQQLPVEYGYHSQIAGNSKTEKWVQVDLGAPVEISAIRVHPCYDDFNSIGAGFGFPVRWRLVGSSDPEFKQNVIDIADYQTADFENPGWYPVDIECQNESGKGPVVRYVRLLANQLAKRADDYILAIAELEILDSQGMNLAVGKSVQYLDSIEAGPRWGAKNLVDGRTPTGDKAAKLAQLRTQKNLLLNQLIPAELRQQLADNAALIKSLQEQRAQLPPPQQVFAGTVHSGSGAFRGTGADGGRPRPIYLLARGNVTHPGREMQPAALQSLFGLPNYFDLPVNHSEEQRRAALAKWLTHPDHPLTWRSMANRIWQYHFGQGIVETPNDFGRMGGTPSHPELLDYLALQLRDNQSLKRLHREIVTSYVYRQSSIADNQRANEIDSQNRLLWRQNRRKLEAESVRDATLFASNSLDLRMGGPGYQDFVIEHPEHSPHYEYDLANPADPATFRRSVYRFIVRSQLQPFMTLLDCADPSIRVDRRNETVSATQALTMLNNGFMLVQAQRFAERLRREVPSQDYMAMSELAFTIALGRRPTKEEQQAVSDLAVTHGWENACRVLLNLNEFSFVD